MQLDVLREQGIKIVIDDFGTGYSSLKLLRQLTLDQIKIDRSFVANATDEKESASIIRALTHIGTSLGLEIITEGVESASQKEVLINAGCTLQQGFYFSHPLKLKDLQSYLNSKALID